MADNPSTAGTVTTLGSTATALGSDSRPMKQIDIRAHGATSEVSIGTQDVSASDRVGFISHGEVFTFGPFKPGIGIRPDRIYLKGTAGHKVTWHGEVA